MAEYWDGRAKEWKQIPKAPIYVLSNDPFFSGKKIVWTERHGYEWRDAPGKINTCVVPCQTWEMAEAVRDYVESRGDQKYIRINITPPRAKSHVRYSLLEAWKTRARRRLRSEHAATVAKSILRE